MQPAARACLVILAAALAASGSGCKDDDPPGVFVDFRIESEAFRPDHILFHWMHAGQAEPTRRRLPSSGGTVSQVELLLYRVFVELPGPLTERRLLAAVGVKGDTVVSGGLLVLQPAGDEIRYETVVLKAPLPDTDMDVGRVPDAISNNCLAVDWTSCYPPGERPPPLPDAGLPDEGPPVDADEDASSDAEPGDDGPDAPPEPPDLAPDTTPNPLLVDLIGYWRLDDGTGGVASDSSGRNNTGSVQAVDPDNLWIPAGMGRWGGAINLPNATGNGITVPASSSIDGIQRNFTIAAMTWRPAERANFATVFARRYMNTQFEFFNLHFLSGTLRGIVNSHQPGGVTQGTVAASAKAPLNAWVHVALTYDGSILRLYQNGTQVSMTPYTAPIVGSGTPLCIGCGQNGSSNTAAEEALGGRLDDVLFWSRTLSADEIRRVSVGEHMM